MQPAINALPLTALCNGLRAVIVDGAGVAGIAGALAVMGVWGAVSFVIGLRVFRWG
jgi:ABC-type multidrug transport system permease subunit